MRRYKSMDYMGMDLQVEIQMRNLIYTATPGAQRYSARSRSLIELSRATLMRAL